MQWRDLLFMHWPIDPAIMRSIIPESLEVDLCQGQAWLGIVPFRMTGVRPRCLPGLPAWLGEPNPSRFNELNVRTYVKVAGHPGVLFFSLDAESRLAVRMARRFFHLPYFDAKMKFDTAEDGWISYQSRRTHADAPVARLDLRYRPVPGSQPRMGPPGTLENFLTERYCLYVLNRQGEVLCGEIQHPPWPLQTAEADIRDLDMTRLLGIDLVDPPTHLHFARRIDVVAWTNVRPGTVKAAAGRNH